MKTNDMIYYLTPFCSEKRLGHIHNQYCALVPNNDDYICILDPDTMFLHPHQQAWIEDVVYLNRGEYDLLGCMTNRIGVEDQKQMFHPKLISEVGENEWRFGIDEVPLFNETDISTHVDHAKYLFDLNKHSIKETNLVAGFLMIFKKSLWNKIKFQEGINFDIKFCEAVKASGGRIGIMQGIYVYHNYRMGKANIKDKTHLLNRSQ